MTARRAVASDFEVIDAGLDGDDDPQALLVAAARETVGLGAVLTRRRPDLLILLGDRYEILGAAQAAVLHRVPIVHLHGGEITEGAFDDLIRHAITKLASLHCCSTHGAAARLRSMGEEPWRIHTTGAPGIDTLVARASSTSASEWQRAIGGEPSKPMGLLTYHPPTQTPERAECELDAILGACERLATVIATAPGADPGSSGILERITTWAAGQPDVRLIESLGPMYAPVLAAVDVVIGNSSSGIVEAPTFGVPVINVGDRQRGRERAPCVIDVGGVEADVIAALDRALDPEFRKSVREASNPFGDGHSARRIADMVATQPLEPLLTKVFVDEGARHVDRRRCAPGASWRCRARGHRGEVRPRAVRCRLSRGRPCRGAGADAGAPDLGAPGPRRDGPRRGAPPAA